MGDLIVAVNDEPVYDHVTATRLMREAPELIKLVVHRDHGREEFDAAAAEFEAVDAAFAVRQPVRDEAAFVIPVLRNQLELTDAASTLEFHLDGAPVGKGGTACTLTVKPEHKGDLTPAACVGDAGSALTLVAVEAVAR